MLRIVHMSDTHRCHEKLDELEGGDVLVHSGDFSEGDRRSVEHFLSWFSKQRHPYKILIAGNHELAFDLCQMRGIKPYWLSELIADFTKEGSNCFYLEHESCDIRGVKFFGSPYTKKISPKDNRWAFTYEPNEGSAYWSDIPKDTDVLITHGPAYGRLDWAEAKETTPPGKAGCKYLRYFVQQIKPKLHMFGHIHEEYGVVADKHTIFSNACMLLNSYTNLFRYPLVFDINENTKETTIIGTMPF